MSEGSAWTRRQFRTSPTSPGPGLPRAEATDPAYWAQHANHTARFNDALHELWQLENPILLEAGPGRTLGVLAMQHPDRAQSGDPVAVSSIRHDYENQSDVEFLWHGIGRLWLAGAGIQWESIHAADRPRRVPLPTYPFEGQHHWFEPIAPVAAAAAAPAGVAGAPGLVRKNPNPAEWLYVPSWKRALARPIGVEELAARLEPGGKWLVFADDAGLAAVLIARLKAAGQDVVTVKAGKGFQRTDAQSFVVEPANPQHYDSLMRDLQASQSLPHRIVHAWSVTGMRPALPEDAAFAHAQAAGFYSLLLLAKSLAAHKVAHEIKLYALSNNVQDVWGTETLCPEKATSLGPCMVIQQEYPNIRVKSVDLALSGSVDLALSGSVDLALSKSVDLDLSGLTTEHESAADIVLGECVGPDSSLFVAYRSGQRWIQTFEPVALEAPARSGTAFRENGVYLVTGGLGNIGVAISEYLAANYRANLVLLGRTPLPGRDSWPAAGTDGQGAHRVQAGIHAIQRIEQLGGTVSYVAADVGDAQAMRAAIEHACQRFGALNGVIHAAGIVGDDGYREIKDCEPGNCERHFHAKARGLRVLEEALQGRALDFCMLVSSLTSFLGGIGHVAYASSNLYMDAYARRHNRSRAQPWLTVNWDLFRFQAAVQSGLGKTLAALGHTAEEAMPVMEVLLAARGSGQLVVSTGELGARIDQWIKLESLNPTAPAAAASPVPSTLAAQPGSQTREDAPRDETEQEIARVWQDALGIERIGVNESFARLGGHSLLAVRIVAELRKAFQIDLPVRALFEAPTIAELARHIKDQIIADIEALSDDEAQQRLVSNE